ncbi:MAG: hypothetical protein PHN88_07455 [Ignavibacteria bacterium]|nr:hypothetical protein [Ignavibacteria bacterium]
MEWIIYVSYFIGGIFLSNSIPHLVSGVMGKAFQTPFAKPSGKGQSSSMVNVLWGMFNLAVGYMLIFRVGFFDLRNSAHVATVGIGFLLMSLFSALNFGQFHGGNSVQKS